MKVIETPEFNNLDGWVNNFGNIVYIYSISLCTQLHIFRLWWMNKEQLGVEHLGQDTLSCGESNQSTVLSIGWWPTPRPEQSNLFHYYYFTCCQINAVFTHWHALVWFVIYLAGLLKLMSHIGKLAQKHICKHFQFINYLFKYKYFILIDKSVRFSDYLWRKLFCFTLCLIWNKEIVKIQ